jgi:tetratricopeptide (TPR) repeat protein
MRNTCRGLLLLLVVSVVAAQSLEPPLSDTRLRVPTLVREDIFAGLLYNDEERMARGEKNIDLLLEKRPEEKAVLFTWKAGTTLYRAIQALEKNRSDEYRMKYRQAMDLLSQARQLDPNGIRVNAGHGGITVILGDRLTPEHRPALWAQGYDSFRVLWKEQGETVSMLPVHLRGELLAGLATTAQRTGRTEEMNLYLDKIIELLPGSPYESVAKEWKKPGSAGKSRLTCLSCHDQGRLANRMADLGLK